jgi:hypothetical protein
MVRSGGRWACSVVFSFALSAVAFAAGSPEPVLLGPSQAAPGSVRSEVVPVANGAQLVVFFERVPDHDGVREGEMPLFAVLRDTLSDDNSANDRLRQVWIFTYSAPSIAQRIAAGIPFFYHRSGLDSGSAAHTPRPVVDMAQPARGAWRHAAYAAVQAEVFDPFGAISRLTTRSYGINLGEYRKTHINEIVNLMHGHADDITTALTPAEFEDLSTRLLLNQRLLGPWVTEEKLPSVFMKSTEEEAENRGRNWDLLRQAAERNGLYFEPLHLADAPDSFAMVSIAQRDATTPANHPFNAQFLRIADPFQDTRISSWKGYSSVWTLDRDGVRVQDGAPGSNQVRMIPLAVYSLDYPGVPLLLIDFRDPSHPQRSEMGLRLANDITTGVLGLTTFGNLSYSAAKTGYLFVHKRHGAATDRMSRRNAFVQLRHALGVDDSLDPELRRDLTTRIEKLNLDPVEKSWSQETRAAWRQYDALMNYATNPRGMARLVETDRWQEYRASRTGVFRRSVSGVFHRRAPTLTAEQIGELELLRRAHETEDDSPAVVAEDSPAMQPVRPVAGGGQ